jgi:16S rRNA (cytosine1402-N4)-methyltransferase
VQCQRQVNLLFILNFVMPHPSASPALAPAAHVPVLLRDVLLAMQPADGEVYADLTFGAGGYSKAILEAAKCRVIAFDRDPDAANPGEALHARFADRFRFIEAPFSTFAEELSDIDVDRVDGVVMDIGVSSMQLDQAERGFSFMKDGPLDMRMSKHGPSAADVVAHFSAERLADIIYIFGDEPKSRSISRAIVKARSEAPIATTRQLAAAIERATGPQRGQHRTHPATKSFQALRIYINDELGQLVDALVAAERVLKPGGRLVVVTFHSLEDRIVKQFFNERTGHLPSASRHAPTAVATRLPSFRFVHKGHVAPDAFEVTSNPRSRSAKLRSAIRTQAQAWGEDSAFFKSSAGLRAQ